ncbi:MAG: 30S ribosomal protein S6 [Spirochaetia bacterium]|nr:30S ribosomal protein S6 [Spirochaetia bacterium]
MQKTNYNEYELVLTIKTGTAETLLKSTTEIKNNLTKRKAEVTEEKDWGKKKLFHLTQKEVEGNFHYLKFKALPETIEQINSDLRVDQSVLKSMIKRLN